MTLLLSKTYRIRNRYLAQTGPFLFAPLEVELDLEKQVKILCLHEWKSCYLQLQGGLLPKTTLQKAEKDQVKMQYYDS